MCLIRTVRKKMLDAIIASFNCNRFVFQQDSAPGASCIQHSSTAAVQNSQLPLSLAACGSITVKSLTPLTMR